MMFILFEESVKYYIFCVEV